MSVDEHADSPPAKLAKISGATAGMIKTVQPNVHIHSEISGFLVTFQRPSETVVNRCFAALARQVEPGIALRPQLRWSNC